MKQCQATKPRTAKKATENKSAEMEKNKNKKGDKGLGDKWATTPPWTPYVQMGSRSLYRRRKYQARYKKKTCVRERQKAGACVSVEKK